MKKVLLALFLMFGFVSANVGTTKFEITDEQNKPQSATSSNSSLNITSGSVGQYYKIKATNLSSNAELSVKNESGGNILLRFNASVESKSQIIYQVSNGNSNGNSKSFASDYYALSSCQVDKSSTNRPTRSFFIMNKDNTKILKFSLRDCETGTINGNEPLNLDTKLLVLETHMSDSSFDPKVQNGSKAYGLPTMIIGEERLIDLSTKSAKDGEEFLCITRENIKSLELRDGTGKLIGSFTNRNRDEQSSKINFIDGLGSKINFTIKNNPGTNYRKMHLKLTCSISWQNGVIGQQAERLYYFDARPKAIKVSGLPKADEWLYAEQKYKSDGSSYDDEFSKAIKGQKDSLTNCANCKVLANQLDSKKMNRITLTPVDAYDKPINDYNSIGEIAIIGKIYGDGTDAISGSSDANIINETNGRNLIRPCVAGSRAGCEIAIAEINGATKKSEIYTGIDNKTKVLAYNNVGPTVLYGADTEWTKYSQNYTAETSGSTPSKSPLCVHGESHSYLKRVDIKGKSYDLVGCNIPFVNEKGGNELNFYHFKPAVYKLLFEGKNSPENESYGTNKLTYIHTIEQKDYDAAKNEIFEAADFNPSILAIGASLESLKNNRALSHYDNHLTVAKQLTFSGNPANPTITIGRSNNTSGIAENFSITAKNNTDISSAIMLTLEPKNPYNHTSGYKSSRVSTDITTNKENITINMPKDNFYAGKNTKANKLNFKREDLLARSYVNIGKSSVNININDTNNAELKKTIEDGKAAFIFSYKGEDLHFVDAAIIAPNVASNGTTADGAVYLAGYCDPASHAACKNSGIFISDAIAGHINYFGFNSLAYGKDKTQGSLFTYDGATFSQFKRGADFLGNFTANEVKIQLKGNDAEKYCKIFRNCHVLGNSKFGTVFNSYKARNTQWHGDGEKQGDTIVDRATSGRKEQRLNF